MDTAKEIKFEELSKRIADDNDKVLVVDVRNHNELEETGKLPGSFCVPLAEVKEAFGNLDQGAFKTKYGFNRPSKEIGNDLVITCRSGRRVGLAIGELKTLGYENLSAYNGSYLDWKQNNGPLEPFKS